MYRFIKKYQKRLFAIFAAFLMVAFAADIGIRRGRTASSVVVGTIGDGEKIYADDIQTAEREWQLLMRTPGFSTRLGPVPLALMLGWDDVNNASLIQYMQGRMPYPAAMINEKPRLFLLLKQEAVRMGVSANEDNVKDIMTNLGQTQTDPEQLAMLEQSIRDLLLVDAAFRRAASTIKISEPMQKFEMSRQQAVTVRLIEFNSADYSSQVPAPTTQQLEAHFNKFANVARGPEAAQPTTPGLPTTNPFGFGYRFPNRVKLQYISIPRAEVRKLVDATKSAYDWDVAARKFYQQNPQQFPSTQPTGGLNLNAASQPSTRPYDQVKDEAKNRVLLPEVDRKINEIQSLITSTMNSDYQAYAQAVRAVGATSAPTVNTSLGVPYNSYQYLEKLAVRVQQQTKVLPTVVSLTDQWRDAQQLRALAGIGGSAMSDGMAFPDYVMTNSDTFLPAERREAGAGLSLFEPTSILREAGGSALGDIFVARVTDAQAAHPAASLDEVRDAVAQDYNAAERLAKAKEAAAKLLETAKQSGLDAAAQQAGKTVITAGPIDGQSPDVTGYSLPPEARRAFMESAFDLLSTPSAAGSKPLKMVELPAADKVVIAQLADVRSDWTADQAPLRLARMSYQIRNQLERLFEVEWFNYDEARKRTQFVSNIDNDKASDGATDNANDGAT